MIWITLLYIGFIFRNSATPGVQSSVESNWVTDLLNEWMNRFGLSFIQFSEGFIRKAAHFAEYSVLGVMLTLSLAHHPFFQGKRRWLLIPIGTVVAIIDEGIQYVTPGRDCNGMDVLLDTCGVIFSVAACAGIQWLWNQRKQKKQSA